MTAPEAKDPKDLGTAVGAPRRFEVSPRVQMLVQDKKAQTEMLAAIAELNWGKGMSYQMRRALGSYLRRNGLDPREIHVLGGNIYRNGKYWLRRLSELVQGEHVEYAHIQFINRDVRLEEDAANEKLPQAVRDDALNESILRRHLRIQHRVPEDAASAALAIVKVKWLAEATVGCKFIVIGRKKKKSDGSLVTADPIGEEFPTETVETRAWRRCLRIIASTNPALKAVEEELKDDELSVTESLQEIAAQEAGIEEKAEAMSAPRQIAQPVVTEVIQPAREMTDAEIAQRDG